jgi:hypothetical protein
LRIAERHDQRRSESLDYGEIRIAAGVAEPDRHML